MYLYISFCNEKITKNSEISLLYFFIYLQAEQRESMEKENQATLADEIDRAKMETDHEKAELKVACSLLIC